MRLNDMSLDSMNPNGTTPSKEALTSELLIASLSSMSAYPQSFPTPVVMHETHVSWVFLAGDFAYKIKKPIQTGFLDYSSLEKRKHFCHEELRLDGRYTDDLYLDVVPITLLHGQVRVEGSGEPIEYAVKMRRFPEDALLSRRLDLGLLSNSQLHQLAREIAQFHELADRWKGETDNAPDAKQFATPSTVEKDFVDCLDDLGSSVVAKESTGERRLLSEWAKQFVTDHRQRFADRRRDGFIRECHGDLHLDNIVHLDQRLVPFDGIEFNESFRWIDVLNDVAFLVMDFVSRGHTDFASQFLNAYLERSGDYQALPLLRWYLVYRSLVRAKVAAIRASQQTGDDTEPRYDCLDHLSLAVQFANPDTPHLWITHGLSGSGKTTASERFIRDRGAIRLRSDLERKRMFQLAPTDRPSGKAREHVYGSDATKEIYRRLRDTARTVLEGGFSCIVDATFLSRGHRQMFRDLSEEASTPWGIVDCRLDENTLRQRISKRISIGSDASDADLDVLECQIIEQEPLSAEEETHVIRNPTR